jgi:hypothetical protein
MALYFHTALVPGVGCGAVSGSQRRGQVGMGRAAVAQAIFVVGPLLPVGFDELLGLQIVTEGGGVGLRGGGVGVADLQFGCVKRQLGGEVFQQVGLVAVFDGEEIGVGHDECSPVWRE